MPYNATTGVFLRTANTFSNPVIGTAIDPDDAEELFDDWDLGLSQVLSLPRGALTSFYLLATSAVAVSHTGSTAETTLATISVPANALGANGVLRITAQMAYSGGTNTWTPRIRFNATAISEQAAFGTTILSARIQAQIANRNATNSQIANALLQGNWSGVASAVVATAHDTTGALNITITGQLTNGADTVRLDSYTVELAPRT